jgi:hypothetical protein
MTAQDDWVEHARRLMAGLGQSFAAAATTADSRTDADGVSDASGGGEHGGDCRWCPVCQALGVLRGERPELAAALADVLGAAAVALRTVAAEAPRGPAGPSEEQPAQQPGDGAAAPVVQRIEIA